MDIKNLIDDLDLIEQVIPDYAAGRRRGLTDDETERVADVAMVKVIEAVEAYQEKETPHPPELKVHPKYPTLGKNYYCKCGVMLYNWHYESEQTNYCGNCGQKLKGDAE